MNHHGLRLIILALFASGCDRSATRTQAAPQARPATAPAADKLLLLEEDPAAKAGTEMADNFRCEVCHLNLAAEEMVVQHAKANVGCDKCHGECDAHIDDESWASGGNGTAPDVMFPPDKINPFCYTCHPKDKIDPDLHRTFLAGVSTEKYCTNCHGKHKLVNRKCKWK
jgi:hypothetical protein